MNLSRKMIALSGMLAFTIIGIAATTPGDDEGHYKNLKVLSKKISEDELERAMHSFEGQLGVTCFYCHVRYKDKQGVDFASDEKKEKEIAREMIKMTLNLNKKYFNTKINRRINGMPVIWCKTCHRGFPRPLFRADRQSGY